MLCLRLPEAIQSTDRPRPGTRHLVQMEKKLPNLKSGPTIHPLRQLTELPFCVV